MAGLPAGTLPAAGIGRYRVHSLFLVFSPMERSDIKEQPANNSD
jgi:hypothetical protein